MFKILQIVLFLVGLLSYGKAEYNFTDQELEATCKPYFCDEGKNYAASFRVEERHKSPGVKFELHLAIKAERDAHILLSSTPFPPSGQAVYEIVIGAGENTFSVLARYSDDYLENTDLFPTPDILSPSKFLPMWIIVTEDGVTTVGIEGNPPIITFRDRNPIDVKYFSFSSYTGVTVKYLYNCPKPGTEEANATLPNE